MWPGLHSMVSGLEQECSKTECSRTGLRTHDLYDLMRRVSFQAHSMVKTITSQPTFKGMGISMQD